MGSAWHTGFFQDKSEVNLQSERGEGGEYKSYGRLVNITFHIRLAAQDWLVPLMINPQYILISQSSHRIIRQC